MKGGKTGAPPGLLQDDSRKLHKWFASRLDARHVIRKNFGDPMKGNSMKTIGELEQENPEGFRNPDDTPVLRLSGTLKTLEQLEAESTDGFRNPERD
jgi:hypothetical protein